METARSIAPILLLPNYLLTFALKGDVKETGGGYMADAKGPKVHFFIATR